MNLLKKFFDRKGYLREKTVESLQNNNELKEGDIVSIAETESFYDIVLEETDISLANNLFAKIRPKKDSTALIEHIKQLATHLKHGHMSKEDKIKIDGIDEVINKKLGKEEKAADSKKLNGVTESVSSVSNSIAKRDSSGDLETRLLRSTYQNQSDISGAIAFRMQDGNGNNYLRFCSDPAAIRQWLQLGVRRVEEILDFKISYDGHANRYYVITFPNGIKQYERIQITGDRFKPTNLINKETTYTQGNTPDNIISFSPYEKPNSFATHRIKESFGEITVKKAIGIKYVIG